MLGYKLRDFLSDEEAKLFTREEGKIIFDDLYEIMQGKKGSFAETVGEDVEKALVMMKAVARMREQDPITSIYVYLFGNTLESEAQFQLKVQATIIKNIRAEAGISQQELSNLSEIKKRTIENWEQGERRITRCALDYLIESSRSSEDDLYSMVQYHTDDAEISTESLDLLKRLSECEFKETIDGHDASDYPLVRYINKSMMSSPEYLIRVEREEYIADGKVTHKHDLFPEDLKKVMDYATRKRCDEVYIELRSMPSSYVGYMMKSSR